MGTWRTKPVGQCWMPPNWPKNSGLNKTLPKVWSATERTWKFALMNFKSASMRLRPMLSNGAARWLPNWSLVPKTSRLNWTVNNEGWETLPRTYANANVESRSSFRQDEDRKNAE